MIAWVKKFLFFCFFFFSLANLIGCSKKSYFAIYVERLENLLGETIQKPRNLASSFLPQKIVADQKNSVTSINLLDFLALQPCKLQLIIAQRNSALGKVALQSQKLINELLFLSLAQECLDRLGPNDQLLKEKIRESIFKKKSDLPATIARATLGGPEYKEMWASSVGDLFFDSKGILALNYIRKRSENWLEGIYHLEDLELEDNLSVLRASPLAEYMRQLLRVNYYLQKLTVLIQEEHRRGGFCRDGVVTDKGIVLRNLVETYFTKASSNEINIASRGSSGFLFELQEFNQLLFDVLTERYKDFFADQFLILNQSKKILREHSAVLKPIVFGCERSIS